MENAQPVHVTNPRHAPENYNIFKGSWSSELQEAIQGVAGVDICAALPITVPTPPGHQLLQLYLLYHLHLQDISLCYS